MLSQATTKRDRTEWSALSLVMASYSLAYKQLAPDYDERREFTIMMTPRNSEAELPTV